MSAAAVYRIKIRIVKAICALPGPLNTAKLIGLLHDQFERQPRRVCPLFWSFP